MHHNKYPKGSEWRKWDFHVHTPESILHNEFGDDWDSFVKVLFKKAISCNIAAIGITDYFFIDGYKKLRNEYLIDENKLAQLFTDEEIERIKNLFIFPNLEFRIEKLVIGKEHDLKWDKKVNCHLILSDAISLHDIQENLLNKLEFEDKGLTDSVKQKKSLTKRNLEELGRRLQEEHQEFQGQSALFVGVVNASINDGQLFEVLKSQESIFKGKFLFGIPTDEDLSRISWNSQGHLSRKLLIQKSHFILSSNPNTRKFGLGEFHASKADFLKEFVGFKPCIWGSDAHKSEKLFNPDMKRNTWIKSNPTFEGLKQIIYEPEERVRIQENIPESKTPYLVIDKVRFIDKTRNKLFTPIWIEFNQNLNSVIGGKSSGKSLLLYHIAKTIDSAQVDEKTKIVPTNNYDDFCRRHPFDFEVMWLSGDVTKLTQSSKEEADQITYIPQIYINRLAEERGEKHLFELIDSILKQNQGFSSFVESQNRKIQDTKTTISQTIDSLMSLSEDVRRLRNEINEIGTEEKIAKEIDRLTDLIDNLRKESGFQPEENKIYESLVRREKFLEEKKTKYQHLDNSVSAFSDYFVKQQKVFENSLEQKLTEYQTGDLEYKVMRRIVSEVLAKVKKVYNDSQSDISVLSDKLIIKTQNISTDLGSVEDDLKPFKKKIKNQTLLKTCLEESQKQKVKLAEFKRKEKELNGIIAKGKKVNSEVLSSYNQLFALHTEIENRLQQDEYKKIEELELTSELRFDTDGFSKFTSLFDGRTKFRTEFYGQFDDHNEFQFDKNRHTEDIRLMFDKLRDLSKLMIRPKRGVTLRDIYHALFDDYFKFHYTITHKGDNILKMSPGKRGLVLLELILHISNAVHPILIDQPEDNLDNRTIYDELNKFVRTKKCNRQIIMVTHNANLVVSTDAETIIVANQSGQQVGQDKKEYVFEYVTGSLENTFIDESQSGILYKFGIKEHVCDILEGGKEAFKEREKKYGFAVNS